MNERLCRPRRSAWRRRGRRRIVGGWPPAPGGPVRWSPSRRPSPRPGIAGAALLGAALAAAAAQAQERPARRELTAADAMALRTPAVADRLGLSDEQRRRVQALIRDHADEF